MEEGNLEETAADLSILKSFCLLCACLRSSPAPLEILVVAIVSRFTEPPSVYGNRIFLLSLLSIFNRLCLAFRKNVTARGEIFFLPYSLIFLAFPLFPFFSSVASAVTSVFSPSASAAAGI